MKQKKVGVLISIDYYWTPENPGERGSGAGSLANGGRNPAAIVGKSVGEKESEYDWGSDDKKAEFT